MTFLQALYGSQYYELAQKCKDASKGRLNGNLFLSAYVIVFIFMIIVILNTFSIDFADASVRFLRSIFGHTSGKVIGRLITFPLLFLIYFTLSKTIGSEANYKKYCSEFEQLPEETSKKANKIILVPFLCMLGVVFIFSMINLV